MTTETGHRQRIRSSLVFSYGSQFAGQGMTVAAEILLARLVLPADWGLYATATMVIMILGAVRDLGIPYQIVREEREDRYGAATTLLLLSSVAVMGIIPLSLPAAMRLLPPEYERLPAVLLALSLSLPLEGMGNLARFIIDKKLVVKKSVIPFLARNLVFAVLGILLGLRGLGVWSLVLAQIASSLTYAALLWVRVLPMVHIRLSFAGARPLLARSLPLFAIWLFTVVTTYIDNGILALRFPLEVVGYYFLAYRWAAIRPEDVFYPALARVVYPAFVAVKNQPEKVLRAYRMSSCALLSLEGLVAWNIFFNAEMVVEVLMGSAWMKAVPLLRLLALWPLVKPFARFGVEILKVTGDDMAIIWMRIVNLALLVAGGWYLTGRYGPEGMAYANYLVLGNLCVVARLVPLFGWKEMGRIGLRFLFILGAPFVILGAVYLLTPADLMLRLQLSAALTPFVAWLYYAAHGREYMEFLRPGPARQART